MENFENHPIDYVAAWSACGQSGEPTTNFVDTVDAAVSRYALDRMPRAYTPGRERNKHYKRLSKRAADLVEFIENLPDDLNFELEDMFTGNEPDDYHENSLGAEHEGLSYLEYNIDQLETIVSEFKSNIAAARRIHRRTAGRPMQNEGLQAAIRELADLWDDLTKTPARSGLTFNNYAASASYQWPFLTFLTAIFWSLNNRELPSHDGLAEAARAALGLRNK